MRTYIFIFVLMIVGLFQQKPSYSQAPIQFVPAAPTIEDYESVLKTFEQAVNKVSDEKFWETAMLKEIKDNKEVKQIKLTELPKLQQKLFIIKSISHFEKKLGKYNGFWKDELAKFSNPSHSLIPPNDDTSSPALKRDIEKALMKLKEIRKNLAKKHQEFGEQIVKEFDKELTKTEKDYILYRIQKYHEVEGLVEITPPAAVNNPQK